MGLRQKPIQEYRPTEEPKAVPTANAGESAELEEVLQVAEAENATFASNFDNICVICHDNIAGTYLLTN